VIPLTGLTPPYLCAFPKQGSGYPTSYVVIFYLFNDLRWEVIVRFVDNGGIVDHHCLNFLFIMYVTCIIINDTRDM